LVSRIRTHIARLNVRLGQALAADELDGRLVLELSQAIERLAQVERVTAGRPAPGTSRPPAAGQPGRPPAPLVALPEELTRPAANLETRANGAGHDLEHPAELPQASDDQAGRGAAAATRSEPLEPLEPRELTPQPED
jgi:hypothetical protein